MEHKFIRIQVSCGSTKRWTEPGYRLSNGVVLLDSERDQDGNYRGGIGMDGAYLITNTKYRPMYNGQKQLSGFQKIALQ